MYLQAGTPKRCLKHVRPHNLHRRSLGCDARIYPVTYCIMTTAPMTTAQFRFAYFTPVYDATVAFYRDGLDFPIVETWNRSRDDRGTLFRAAAGMIEVLAMPHNDPPDHLFDSRPPQGAFMVIEVEFVDALYQRVQERRIPIQQDLRDQTWGHRSFCVREPNGLTLYLFHEGG